MLYVFDTSAIRNLQSYYPDTFPTFWESFEGLYDEGRIISVAEAKKELKFQATEDFIEEWISRHSDLFTPPSVEEQEYVAEIFRVEHFQQLIGKKQLAKGYPVADPFLIARGWHLAACVVTQEVAKPNSAKIPNVCDHFGVDHCDLRGFLRREGWKY